MSTSIQTTATAETPGFIDEKELLRRVPFCRRSLANHRKEGKIPFVKLGRRILYHWPSVEAALLRQQRGGID